MHTSSIKLCQTKEVYSCMLQTYIYLHTHPDTHTHTHWCSVHLCCCLLPLSPDSRKQARTRLHFAPWRPSSLSESQVFIELSLWRKPSRHPHTPLPTLSVANIHCFFLSLFVFVSQVRTALIYFSYFLFSSLLVLFSHSLHSTHKFFFLHSFFFHSIRSLWWQLPPYFIIICPNFNLETSWPCSCGFKGKLLHLSI